MYRVLTATPSVKVRLIQLALDSVLPSLLNLRLNSNRSEPRRRGRLQQEDAHLAVMSGKTMQLLAFGRVMLETGTL